VPQRQLSRLKAHDSDDPVGGACDVMRHAFLRWTMRALPTCVCSLAYARRWEGAVASAAREHNQLSAVERPWRRRMALGTLSYRPGSRLPILSRSYPPRDSSSHSRYGAPQLAPL